MLANQLLRRQGPAMAERDAMPLPHPAAITADIAGTCLTVVERGPDRLALLIGMIDSARTSIRLLFYMFLGDRSGTEVRDALARAARRGCDVRLVVDSFGSGVSDDFFRPVTEAGGHCCLFHPSIGRRYLLRNHQKLVVVDDRQAIIGGANIADAYFADGPQAWRDLWLTLDGAAVKPAGRYFDAVFLWTTTRGAKIRTLRRLIQRHSQHKGALQWSFSGPMRRRNPWPLQVAREIITASRLDIISAYFSPPFSMLRRIARAGRRGCVRIITAARSDNNATIAAARHTYAKLLRNGVEMYEYQPQKLHTKLAIVDDVVHIGSSNFDFRSLYLNLEVMLRIDDRGFADQMRLYFEREKVDSLRITPELHKARASWWRRLKWTLSHFLVTTMDYTVTRRLSFGPEL